MAIKVPVPSPWKRRDRIERRARAIETLLVAHRLGYPDSTAPPVPTLEQIEAVLYADDRIDTERRRNGVVETRTP